jgi:hypothetical protein
MKEFFNSLTSSRQFVNRGNSRPLNTHKSFSQHLTPALFAGINKVLINPLGKAGERRKEGCSTL